MKTKTKNRCLNLETVLFLRLKCRKNAAIHKEEIKQKDGKRVAIEKSARKVATRFII